MKSWQQTFVFGAGFGAAFLLGQGLPSLFGRAATGDGTSVASDLLQAQGRGPTNPPPPGPQPNTPNTPNAPAEPAVVYVEETGGQGASASGNGFLAVTGSYGVGTSVMYLVDTVNRQLAVYEARGGSSEQRRVILVGARRIDLDLQLERYNDRSEYEYRELKKLFEKRGDTEHDVRTGLEPGPAERK